MIDKDSSSRQSRLHSFSENFINYVFYIFMSQFKAFGRPIVMIFTISGLLSLWAVHVAGFMVIIPSGLQGLIDMYFLGNFISYFSLIAALCFLIARYVPIILKNVVSFFVELIVTVRFVLWKRRYKVFKRVGRRFHNLEQPDLFAPYVASTPTWLYLGAGISYFCGRASVKYTFWIESYAFLISTLSVLFALIFLYVEFNSALIILVILVLQLLLFEPSPIMRFLHYPRLSGFRDFVTFLSVKPQDWLSIRKIVLIALTFSFLMGISHHLALRQKAEVNIKTSFDTIRARIIANTSSGILLWSGKYIFISDSEVHFIK